MGTARILLGGALHAWVWIGWNANAGEATAPASARNEFTSPFSEKMTGDLIRRNKTAGIALLLAIAFIPAVLWRNERHSGDSEAPGAARRQAPSGESSGRADAGPPGRHLRKTLRDNLPQGAEILKRDGPGIAVSLPHGTTIQAAGAAVTETGVSFKGPYRVALQNGSSLSSDERDSIIHISQDDARVKLNAGEGVTFEPAPE